MATAPLLEARGLTRRFGTLVAVDRVDLDLAPGEVVAVFGPNGAGKTTLLRILARTLRPSAGFVRIAGRDAARDGDAARQRIGLLSHHTFLYDDLTARDNLAFFAALHGVDRASDRIGALLEDLGLSERADDPVRTFSRGMQQRLSLARALLHDPAVVLLDEPFSGLDPHASTLLRETLAGVRGRGRAILATTHDLREGLAISDRWIFLSRGRIASEGRSAAADPAALERAYRGPAA